MPEPCPPPRSPKPMPAYAPIDAPCPPRWTAAPPCYAPPVATFLPGWRKCDHPTYLSKHYIYNPPTRTELPDYHWPKVAEPEPKPPTPPPVYSCGPPQHSQYNLPPPPYFPSDPLHYDGGRELHSILSRRNHNPEGANLFWFVFDDPFYYARWDDYASMPVRYPGQLSYNQSATKPTMDVNSIRIRYDHIDSLGQVGRRLATFNIPRNTYNTPLTVGEVLLAIHRHFMTILSPEQLQEASQAAEEVSIIDSRYHRTRLRTGFANTQDPLRYVDTLGNLSRFGGLRVTSFESGVLELHLDLLAGPERGD
ncbi:hypothetical protein H0H92_000003 [Tricholoma furcatifolium]|nr:hypothetical protein H0H92_000003 [Tricholoma furcatifolium]